MRIKDITNIKNIQAVINIGYSPICTGLRFKDIELFHKFFSN